VNSRVFCPYPEGTTSASGQAICFNLQWAIVVTDTGRDLPRETLPYIFETFERVSGTGAGVHPSSGLGLSVVKNLVYLMGGHVNVDSEVGRGSTFTILLPLASVREKQR
jgi:signal transduction histidine kinase